MCHLHLCSHLTHFSPPPPYQFSCISLSALLLYNSWVVLHVNVNSNGAIFIWVDAFAVMSGLMACLITSPFQGFFFQFKPADSTEQISEKATHLRVCIQKGHCL